MSFPIIPGSRGAVAAIAGRGSEGEASTGEESAGTPSPGGGGDSRDDSGGGSGAGSGDASCNATGARDPQRIRTLMGDPFSKLTERAATSIACRRALQNWSSNAPDYQDEGPGWRAAL